MTEGDFALAGRADAAQKTATLANSYSVAANAQAGDWSWYPIG